MKGGETMPYGDGTGPVWGRGIGCGVPRGYRARFFRRGFGRGLGFRRFWGEPFEGDYVPMTPETEREILEQEKQYLTQRLAYIQERLGKE